METPYNIYDYEVLDRNGNRIGPVTGFWVDEATSQPEFASVKTGWIMGKQHLIPIRDAAFDHHGRKLRVPYEERLVKDAPGFAPEQPLTAQDEQRIYEHYRLPRSLQRSPSGLPSRSSVGAAGGQAGSAEIPLHEEKVDVGKQAVATGQVRLRKVVKTETREIPVELKRERIEIERIPAEKLKGSFSGRAWTEAFREQEMTLTERREEPVIQKRSEVVGGVRATKDVSTERRNVEADVRREDVEVDRGAGTRRDFPDE